MKTVIITNYTFDASLKKITFNDFTEIDIRRVISITDVTNGQQIYFYKSATFNGSVATNVLTLNYNTDALADNDDLIIEYAMDNVPFEVMASVTRTTSGTSADLTCYSKGMKFIFDVTAVSGTSTPTITPKIQIKDFHGNYVDIAGAVTAGITTTGQTVLIVHPDITAVANLKVNDFMPRTYRINWTMSGTTPSFTFRVNGQPLD